MTKRTFVLFFCLANLLALSLFTRQEGNLCKLNFASIGISSPSVNTDDASDQAVAFDDFICQNQCIVRADGCEWKEGLSDLLRHRNSTYRFITLKSEAFYYFSFSHFQKLVRQSAQLPVVAKGLITLPDYYSFLHRLCPF